MGELSGNLLINSDDGEEDSSSLITSQSFSSSFKSLGDTFRRLDSRSGSMQFLNTACTSSPESLKKTRDQAAIERNNLVNICKLIVKELIEQSLRQGRILDTDHAILQHFFIVMEHVLRHGLKPKKGLLGPKKEIWDVLQCIEHFCSDAQYITTSVRDLPTVRTNIGRARAWFRIALMQKKLADYLQILLEHKDNALIEFYEPHALMMTEEVIVIFGILVGLNVIDFNLCVKEENLDLNQGVIDFSLYLRSSNHNVLVDDDENGPTNIDNLDNMNNVLDQKNYIEELNRHLKDIVGSLQAKVNSLTATNALLKDNLNIARNSLLEIQAEYLSLRDGKQGGTISNDKNDSIDPELIEALNDEQQKRIEIEKELELQTSLKAETEMAIKLMEKDIHDKQDTIFSLRRQLDDIKQMNAELSRKLQECEGSLKHKTELLSKLETQKEAMVSAIADLEKKYLAESNSLSALQETSNSLSMQVVSCEEKAARAEANFLIERELSIDLKEKEAKHLDHIKNLQFNIKQLHDESKKHDQVKLELEKYKKQWSEAQTTLEELGFQLSISKLKVSELQEKAKGGNGKNNELPVSGSGLWTPDNMTSKCKGCNREFTLTRRKHHCRNCGEIFCNNCSEQLAPLPNEDGHCGKPVRVCDGCWEIMNAPKN